MKKSYTVGTKFDAEIEVYAECKYAAHKEVFENSKTVRYNDIESWEIISGGEEAEEIEKNTDGSCIDDYHEYLVLNFTNGDTATFRNSYVDMFRI